jgi:hypothetical protein
MAEQRGGFGKVVLWVVLAVVGIIVAGNVIGWILGALWNILLATLIIGAIGLVGFVLVRAARRSVTGGNDRRRLPR